MSIVTISIHKHECAICGCLFVWRPAMPDQEGCACTTQPIRAEFCNPCIEASNEAGWIGKLARQLVDRTISLDRRLEAIETVRVKATGQPFKELYEATEEVKRLWNSAASFDGTEGTVSTQAMERLLSALSPVLEVPR